LHTFDFVSVGAYTKDTIVTRSGTRQVHGGGYSYSAHAARLLDQRVGAVTRLAREDIDSTRLLKESGVEVMVRDSARSTVMCLEYPTANVDERILTVTDVADPFQVADVEDVQAEAILISASIRGEVSLAVAKAIRARAGLLGVDVQGFVRIVTPEGKLIYQSWPEISEVLSLVDVLKTDAVEAEFLTGHSDIRAAARKLANYGPKEIVLTHKDGLLVYANGSYFEQPFRPTELRGRSGRGDTCVGSYLSSRLQASPEQSTKWAAALTSLKLEAEGPIRCARAEVEDLIRRQYS
jgi:sugar/nucleoside kinase (ribokinase family)